MDIYKLIEKFNISSEREEYGLIHETVEKGIYFKGTNLWILIFAIVIACVGLNVNSTAVIIGAMLISPLMGPILGMGYSLATYDFKLFRKALANFGFAVGASLATSTLYFLLTPLSEAHSELLARTQPNIYDVIIAMVGGLAGIVALSSKQKGNVIPGAAIATALMPPLCTAGYGLSTANWSYFFGAFYLFTINTVFIAAATLVTVRFLKYPIWHQTEEGLKQRANMWVSIIVTITMIPSIYFGYVLVKRERFKQEATRFIKNETYIEGDYLLKSDIDPLQKIIHLTYGGKLIPEPTKKKLQEKLKNYTLMDAQITIQQGFSFADADNDLLELTQQQAEINRLRSELSLNLKRQDSIQQRSLLGQQLLKELKPLFPEVQACATAEQVFYNDSLKMQRYHSLTLQSRDIKKTFANKERITTWFQHRLQLDSIRVYIERAL
ncbi:MULTISPECIES: DUF389 domain-containing protein [Olivibacter]|uniref:DUF389 domain-containing protein n=1 Tax=Olivibacter jilunii TaxID=985016 RepID=A0ABW6B7G9_9SPHI|nr:DUF389 domain-containing protein [Pseudosphingobacterium sp.]